MHILYLSWKPLCRFVKVYENYDIIWTSCPNPSHIVEYLHCLEEKETRETRRGLATEQRTNHIQSSVGQFIVALLSAGGTGLTTKEKTSETTVRNLNRLFY